MSEMVWNEGTMACCGMTRNACTCQHAEHIAATTDNEDEPFVAAVPDYAGEMANRQPKGHRMMTSEDWLKENGCDNLMEEIEEAPEAPTGNLIVDAARRQRTELWQRITANASDEIPLMCSPPIDYQQLVRERDAGQRPTITTRPTVNTTDDESPLIAPIPDYSEFQSDSRK